MIFAWAIMKRIALIIATNISTLVAPFAASDAIEQRIRIMKANGAATKEAAAMLKGQAPFDLAKIQSILRDYQENTTKFITLFPDDTKNGGDTSASQKIWSDPAGFKAENEKFANDAKAAASAIKDEASFKVNFPVVIKNCGDCHESYRIKN